MQQCEPIIDMDARANSVAAACKMLRNVAERLETEVLLPATNSQQGSFLRGRNESY
jgi:hypothetical protein